MLPSKSLMVRTRSLQKQLDAAAVPQLLYPGTTDLKWLFP